MKTKLLFLTLFLMGLTLTAKAQFNAFVIEKAVKQDTIGQLQLLVQYDLTAYIDTTNKENPVKETMMLEIGKNLSKFYSYPRYVLDSVFAADVANKASQETINEHLQQYNKGRISEVTVNGYPSGKVTTLDEVGGLSKIRCEEARELPQWSIAEDTTHILSYLCQKATCHYKGRKWTAWYTTEIPLSEGPWKLYGLPGMILKAEDSEGHYSFIALGVEKAHTNRPILYKGKTFESMNRKTYNKVHERFYDDPVGFVNGCRPGVTMKVTDEHGNPMRPRGLPHNPIERAQ